MKLINATKISDTHYKGTILFDEPVEVRGIPIVKTKKDKYIVYPPKLKTEDGLTPVITWNAAEANAIAKEFIEAGKFRQRKTFSDKVNESGSSIIGYAIFEIACTLDVDVYLNKEGTPYIRLPGRPYKELDKNGNEVEDVEYFINIKKVDRKKLAREIFALANEENT